MATWQILVWDVAGVAKTTVTPADAVASIDRLGYDAYGSCTEAAITIQPAGVDIVARDTIQVQYALDDVGLPTVWTPVWTGIVTVGGNPYAEDLFTITAVGLKQRLYEIVIDDRSIAGDDVATVGRAATVAAADGRVVQMTIPAGLPDIGFVVGDRYPNRQTVGDFLDDLAATVGSFTVPTGETYTYSLKTWTEGEVVPAATWGVTGEGLWFFVRPRGDPREFNESSNRVDVTWNPVAAEQVNDQTVLVYASEPNGGNSPRAILTAVTQDEANMTPLALRVGSGTLEADRLFVLDGPLDYMTAPTPTYSGNGSITNLANAFDGDPLTFASMNGDADILAEVATTEGAIILIDYASSANARAGSGSPNTIVYVSTLAGTTDLGGLIYQFPAEAATRRIAYYPISPFGASSGTPTKARLLFYGANGVLIYRILMYVPDADIAARLAETLARPVPDAVAEVAFQGWLRDLSWWTSTGNVRPNAIVTPLVGSPVEGTVGEITVSITAEEGVVTRLQVGQKYQPDDAVLAVVLERLARRAVAERGAMR